MLNRKILSVGLFASMAMLTLIGCPHHHYDDHHPPPPSHDHDHDHDHDYDHQPPPDDHH